MCSVKTVWYVLKHYVIFSVHWFSTVCIVFFKLKYSEYLGRKKSFFLKIGDESGRGSILTEDGQETLSMAQSVLTALVASISDASVTVEILVLLQKYRVKFLELLLKTTCPSAREGTKADTREEGENILDERIGEIEEFEAVKEKVVSFVTMCDLIGPGEISLKSRNVFYNLHKFVNVLNMFCSKLN